MLNRIHFETYNLYLEKIIPTPTHTTLTLLKPFVQTMPGKMILMAIVNLSQSTLRYNVTLTAWRLKCQTIFFLMLPKCSFKTRAALETLTRPMEFGLLIQRLTDVKLVWPLTLTEVCYFQMLSILKPTGKGFRFRLFFGFFLNY